MELIFKCDGKTLFVIDADYVPGKKEAVEICAPTQFEDTAYLGCFIVKGRKFGFIKKKYLGDSSYVELTVDPIDDVARDTIRIKNLKAQV